MITIKDIAKANIIQEAFEHVYKRRNKRHHNNDIWHVSLNWYSIKNEVITKLQNGTYQLSPMKHYKIEDAGKVGVV